MKKLNAQTFALELKKRNGLDKAYSIAQGRMQGTDPKQWSSLPSSTIYFAKDRKGSSGASEKKMRSVHGFWTQTFHILNKMYQK